VAALLTGLLCNHFLDEPHPIVVIDGNQSGIGKTLLAQIMGHVLDGIEPARISLTSSGSRPIIDSAPNSTHSSLMRSTSPRSCPDRLA